MSDRRQAFRREPIEIDLGGKVISVDPIPWEQRGDFGNEVVRQNVEITNNAVRIFVTDEGIPQLEAKLSQKFTDPYTLLRLGLPTGTFEDLKEFPLYSNQVIAILLAICEVNELQQLYPLLDPNSTTPTALSGIVSELLSGSIGAPTESGLDSSSPDSIGQLSAVSPTQSSDES